MSTGVKIVQCNTKPSYDINWYINDTDDIFFGGTHYRELIKKDQWVKRTRSNTFYATSIRGY